MGQLVSCFRNLCYMCRFSSDSESIDSAFRDTHVSPISFSTTNPIPRESIGDLNLTDQEAEHLFQTDPGNTDTAGDLEILDFQVEHLSQNVVSATDPGNTDSEGNLKPSDPEIAVPNTDPDNAETRVDLKLDDPETTSIEDDLKLSDSQIEAIAREIEVRKMESIAISDLGIGIETVNNLKVVRQGDYMGFNRDLLVQWRNKNPGINEVQVSKIVRKNFENDGVISEKLLFTVNKKTVEDLSGLFIHPTRQS